MMGHKIYFDGEMWLIIPKLSLLLLLILSSALILHDLLVRMVCANRKEKGAFKY